MLEISAREALRLGILRLQAAGIDSAALDGRILLEFVLQISREELLFSLDLPITKAQYAKLERLLELRAKHKPIAQIIGKREFWGLNFAVSEATLDPRADSETLIEAVLERVHNRNLAFKILDLGTGTGCLLLSLLSELPNARGVGAEVSRETLAIARKNAKNLGLEDRADFVQSNWAENVSGKFAKKFDIIISNPPYIPSAETAKLAPEVAEFEPKLALDGGNDGFDCYRAIMKQLPNSLKENGFAAFEIGMGQGGDLSKIAAENGLKVVGEKKDLGGIIRCIILTK